VGINPADAKIQKFAFIPFTYPLILGNHVAGKLIISFETFLNLTISKGVVYAKGEGVDRFEIDDRVVSHLYLFSLDC